MCITFSALLLCLLYDSVPFVLSQVVEPMNSSLSQTSAVSILSLKISIADVFRSPTITPQNDLIPVSSILLATSNELSMPINTIKTSHTALVASYQAQILHFDSSHRATSTTIEWITKSASVPPSTSTTTITYLPDGSENDSSKSAISTTDFTTTTQVPPESPTSTIDTSTPIVSESTISTINSDTTTLIPIYTINSSTATQTSSVSETSKTIQVPSATSPTDFSTTTQILAESTIATKVTSTTNQISYESTISTIYSSTEIPSESTTSMTDSNTTTLIPTYTIQSSTTSVTSSESAASTTDSSATTQVRITQNSRPSRSLRTSTIEIISTTLDISTSTIPTATDFVTPSSPLDQTFSNKITSLISTSRVSTSGFNSEPNTIMTTPITPTSAATINPAPALTSSVAASVRTSSVSSSPITGSFLPGDMAASTTVTYLNSTYTLIQVYTRSLRPS